LKFHFFLFFSLSLPFYLFLKRILFHPLTPFQGKNDLGLDVMLPDRTAEFCISDESQKKHPAVAPVQQTENLFLGRGGTAKTYSKTVFSAKHLMAFWMA
jgi:hypothetical protein